MTGSRRTIRPKVDLIQQCKWNKLIPSKNDGRKVMKMTNLFSYNILIRSGLAFKYLAKTLKSICQAPVRLIGKRGLICDHSQFVDIKYLFTFWENICLLLKKLTRSISEFKLLIIFFFGIQNGLKL